MLYFNLLAFIFIFLVLTIITEFILEILQLEALHSLLYLLVISHVFDSHNDLLVKISSLSARAIFNYYYTYSIINNIRNRV